MKRPLKQQRRILKPSPLRRQLDEPRDDTRDAARWRALMSSQRVRVLSDAPGAYNNVAKGAHYLMVEFISELADPSMSTLPTKHLLIAYADAIIKEKSDAVD